MSAILRTSWNSRFASDQIDSDAKSLQLDLARAQQLAQPCQLVLGQGVDLFLAATDPTRNLEVLFGQCPQHLLERAQDLDQYRPDPLRLLGHS